MLLLQSEDGEIDGDENDAEDDDLSKDLEDDSLGGPISRIHGFYKKPDMRSVTNDSDNDFWLETCGLGLWEEARENPVRHRENMQTAGPSVMSINLEAILHCQLWEIFINTELNVVYSYGLMNVI